MANHKRTSYREVIKDFFNNYYQEGIDHFEFTREEISQVCENLNLNGSSRLGMTD